MRQDVKSYWIWIQKSNIGHYEIAEKYSGINKSL